MLHRPILFAILTLALAGCTSTGSKGSLADKLKKDGVRSLTINSSKGSSVARIGTKVSPRHAAEADAAQLLRACYEIAVAQSAGYFVVLEQASAPRSITTVGFTNQAKPKIQEEFGSQFSPTDTSGKPRQVFSVEEVRKSMPSSTSA